MPPSDRRDDARTAAERAALTAQRRVRRRLGGALLAVAAALTVWELWGGSITPPPPAPVAAEACGPHAPADAVPVSLPVASLEAWRALRGVVVCFTHDLTVTEVFDLGRHGELTLADRRLFGPNTGLALDDDALHMVRLGARQRPPAPPWPLPWGLEVGGIRVGDAVVDLVGRVWSGPDGGYLIEPLAAPTFEQRNPRPRTPPDVGGTLRVAALNLENYFVTLGSRGADHPSALARQTEKLVAALSALDADVIAVMEVERDDDGAALEALALALNQALARAAAAAEDAARDGAPTAAARRYTPLPPAPRSASGAGDAIRQGFLVDTATVEVLALDADVAQVHERPPQALTLRHRASGQVLSVVAVHLRSKGGCPSAGDVDAGYGCWNLRRSAQADALLGYAARLEAAHGGLGVLIVGDVNTHRHEPPLRLFDDAGWTVASDSMPAEEARSYVFFGRSAALDHALASPSLAPHLQGAAYWPINADEPPLAGSGRGAQAPRGYRPDAFRSSDHDPLLVGLALTSAEP